MILRLSLAASLLMTGAALSADEALQKQVEELTKQVQKLQKDQKRLTGSLSEIKTKTGGDNIKWSIDFRAAYENLDYKYNDEGKALYGRDGRSVPGVWTNRMWLGMSAMPLENLTFFGEIAMYKTWGGNKISANEEFQNVDWRGVSRPDDAIFRIRNAAFVYAFAQESAVPMSLSIGRRPAANGFLANHREDEKEPGSPLAHVTNMEVDGAMLKFDLSGVLWDGAYIKTVYGRAHDPINYTYGATPYIYDTTRANKDDEPVDFIVFPMALYYDGQHNVMAQHSIILNSKGTQIAGKIKKAGAGTTQLSALSYQIDGLSEESDFLADTTLFASVAMSMTSPDEGYTMSGSEDDKVGSSYWVGATFPDMLFEGGRIGLEYNYGSKYWAPMTWAEDTLIGSKIATRGSAYEAYWNLPIAGRNLTAQLRYTYIKHDYAANTICYWESPESPDFNVLESAQNVRLSIRYRY